MSGPRITPPCSSAWTASKPSSKSLRADTMPAGMRAALSGADELASRGDDVALAPEFSQPAITLNTEPAVEKKWEDLQEIAM